MSERITSKNLDAVLQRNTIIHKELEKNAQTVRVNCNKMQLFISVKITF